jgi:hypothetical protein
VTTPSRDRNLDRPLTNQQLARLALAFVVVLLIIVIALAL